MRVGRYVSTVLCGACGSGQLDKDEYGRLWCLQCNGLVMTAEQRRAHLDQVTG